MPERLLGPEILRRVKAGDFLRQIATDLRLGHGDVRARLLRENRSYGGFSERADDAEPDLQLLGRRQLSTPGGAQACLASDSQWDGLPVERLLSDDVDDPLYVCPDRCDELCAALVEALSASGGGLCPEKFAAARDGDRAARIQMLAATSMVLGVRVFDSVKAKLRVMIKDGDGETQPPFTILCANGKREFYDVALSTSGLDDARAEHVEAFAARAFGDNPPLLSKQFVSLAVREVKPPLSLTPGNGVGEATSTGRVVDVSPAVVAAAGGAHELVRLLTESRDAMVAWGLADVGGLEVDVREFVLPKVVPRMQLLGRYIAGRASEVQDLSILRHIHGQLQVARRVDYAKFRALDSDARDVFVYYGILVHRGTRLERLTPDFVMSRDWHRIYEIAAKKAKLEAMQKYRGRGRKRDLSYCWYSDKRALGLYALAVLLPPRSA
jgi:hypothetical protein